MQQKPARRPEERPKELTARERALEFARNVPKPKIRNTSQMDSNQDGSAYNDG